MLEKGLEVASRHGTVRLVRRGTPLKRSIDPLRSSALAAQRGSMASSPRASSAAPSPARRNLLALLAGSLLLGGCAFRTQATGMAVDYNDFVAQTTNRQTVLNILRAREREPMHFTSFSEVFGQIRGQGTASLGAPSMATAALSREPTLWSRMPGRLVL